MVNDRGGTSSNPAAETRRATPGERMRAGFGRNGRIALAAALLVHAVLVVSIARQPLDVNRAPVSARSIVWPLYNDTVHRPGPWPDLLAVYHAGVAARQGGNPYESAENPPRTPYFFAYRYLPVVGETLGRFLSVFPPRAAALLWMALLEAVLAGFLALYIARTEHPGLRLFAPIVLLLSSPYLLELSVGQFTFAALALTGAALLLLEDPKPRSARWGPAAAWSGSVLLKVFPLVTAPAFLRDRNGRICVGAGLLLLFVLNVPWFLSHPGTWSAFYQDNFGTVSMRSGVDSGNFGFDYVVYRTVRLFHAWKVPEWTAFVQAWRILLLAGSAAAVLLARRRCVVAGAALLVFAHFLSFHHVWEHHLSGAIPIALLLLRDRLREGDERAAGITAAAIILLAMPSPFVFLDRALDPSVQDPSTGWSAGARIFLPLCKVAPVMALYAVALQGILRRGARTA